MSSSARLVAVLLFTLWCMPASLHAQSTTKAPAKAGRGTVSGRVTIKDKPAVGVTVGLRQTTNGMPLEKVYKGVTDQEGVYHITNVPAGGYDIMPAAPAYVMDQIGFPRGKTVLVGNDENVEDINFTLIRGGVITGKITDVEGRPLIQHQVSLYRTSDLVSEQRQVFAANNVQTDDRGIYRFFGLMPGRYKVACGRGEEPFVATFRSSRIIYKQVFYPDATDHNKATVIDVKEGGESTNIDISMGAPVQTFAVSGRVVDDKNQPFPNIRFAFQRMAMDRYEVGDGSAVSNNLGEFVAEGLMPGKYGVVLYGNQNQDVRVDQTLFDIVDRDVAGLTVRLVKASSISGVVVLEPENTRAMAKLTQLQLRAYVNSPSGAPASGSSTFGTIGPDGSFRIPGLSPGQVNFWLSAPNEPNAPKGFLMLRIEYNGVAVPRGLEIKDNDQLTGVRIVMSYGTASIRGNVTIANGALPDGSRMFVRVMRQGTPQTPVASAMVDARGQFLVEGLPAGLYEVIVTAFVQNGKIQANTKREVNVQDGMVNEVSLTLDVTPLLKP